MTNYQVYEYISVDNGDRADVLIANQFDAIEKVIEYLASIGIVLHLVPPRTYSADPDARVLVEDVTWAITVELWNGSWLFYHVYDEDLLTA